jgi:hypothetical protein
VVSFLPIGPTSPIIGVDMFRVKSNGLREVYDGFVKLAFLHIGNASGMKCPIPLRLEPHGLGNIGYRFIVITFLVVDAATTIVRLGIFRVKSNELGEV